MSAKWNVQPPALPVAGPLVPPWTQLTAYHPDVYPHQFRHTFASDWRSKGGSEGDLMRLMGWRSRAMLDRYGEDMADRRAFDAKQQMGNLY